MPVLSFHLFQESDGASRCPTWPIYAFTRIRLDDTESYMINVGLRKSK